jgi:siroheme synthase-like protein
VILPAIVRRGPLTVAIGTGGTSPALARAVREHLERALPPAWTALAELAGEVRRQLRAGGHRPSAAAWQAALRAALQSLLDGAIAESGARDAAPNEAARRIRARAGACA